MSEPTPSMETVLELVHQAGQAILEVYRRGDHHSHPAEWVEVHEKSDATPVTEADWRAHRILVQGLRALTPDVPVISEEGVGAHPSAPEVGDRYWLVDPLDGTREFLSRTGEFTVNVGLVREGHPVAGVVHLPPEGRSWVGSAEGAWLLDGTERRPVAARPADPRRLTLAASRSHRGRRLEALVRSFPQERVITAGSSVKLCLLAEGRADLYLRDTPTSEWDTAAAHAVLQAAGGAVFTLEGEALGYGKPGLQNPPFVAVGDPELDWKAVLEAGEEP